MAITYGFYNSENGDRVYNATDLTKIFDGIIQDGVFQTIGDHFVVTEVNGENSSCYVGTGKAWLDHTYTVNDTMLTLNFDAVTTGAQSRIDAVVIDIDIENRENDIIIVKGEQATNPVKPTLINDTDHKQYALAYITIKGSENSVVKTANIENNIGSNNNTDADHPVLPYVLGAMEAVTQTQYIRQLEAQITAWFNGMKNQLTQDAAIHLQDEIDEMIVVGTEPLTNINQFGSNGKIYIQYYEA